MATQNKKWKEYKKSTSSSSSSSNQPSKKPQERISERNKTNKGQHSREDRRKIARKKKKFTHNIVIVIEQLYRQLKFGDIKGEAGSTIVAAQDQAISTNQFKKKFLKEKIHSKCRLCKQHKENIDHQTTGCDTVANNE